MVNAGGLTASKIARVFYQTSAAVEHVHKCGLTHRDIKVESLFFALGLLAQVFGYVLLNVSAILQLENFLISASGRVKLCDFGSATNVLYTSDEIARWDYNKKMLIEEQVN